MIFRYKGRAVSQSTLDAVRYLPRYILLLLAALAAPAPAAAQIGTSWWYPFGTPEANRRLTARTESQTDKDLIIKWRTTTLKNSSTLLVGSLERGRQQQVVGMTDNILTILTHRGLPQTSPIPYAGLLPPGGRAVLTGLFDTTGRSTAITAFPTSIGIGVEGSSDIQDSLRAFLTDGRGAPRITLSAGIPRDVVDSARNRWARLYPITSYRPPDRPDQSAILAVLSQDRFQTRGVAAYNKLLRYHFRSDNPNSGSAVREWDYPAAPMLLPQQPALAVKSGGAGEPDTNAVALGTAAYTGQKVSVRPSVGVETWADSTYSINLRIDDPTRPIHLDTRRIPPPPDAGELPDAVHNHVAQLFRRGGTSPTYRIITENHDAAHPGTAGIFLANAVDPDQSRQGYFVDSTLLPVNVGWSVLTADLDGNAPAGYQPNNTNEEIVAAWNSLDGSELPTSWIYVLGTSLLAPGDAPLTMIARQRLDGRLMGAADLVDDSTNRTELVIAKGDSLYILQLKDYHEPDFYAVPTLESKPFRLVKGFKLDAPIVSVALADLEGDQENDIVVSTTRSTYAIGRPFPLPFDVITASADAICQGDSTTVKWRRQVGGGEQGVSIELSDGQTTIPVGTRPVTAIPDSLRFGTSTVPGGVYRILVRDLAAPSVVDSTPTTLVIRSHEIAGTALADPARVYRLGDTVTITGTPRCFDGAAQLLQGSGSPLVWTPTTAAITRDGSTITARVQLRCPSAPSCDTVSDRFLFYRFAPTEGALLTDPVAVEVENHARTLTVTPADSGAARRRTVAWSPADFDCDRLRITVDDGTPRDTLVANADGRVQVTIPADRSGRVTICIHCEAASDLYCATGHGEFVVTAPRENFVSPNPFDPNHPGNALSDAGASIRYRLPEPSTVTITIYDQSRSVVRRILDGTLQEVGAGEASWDGRNSRGEIVADGAYICVIETSSQEPIILPILVLKR